MSLVARMTWRRIRRAPQYAIVAILSITAGVSSNAVALAWLLEALHPTVGIPAPESVLVVQHQAGTDGFLGGEEVDALRATLDRTVLIGSYRAGMAERFARVGTRGDVELRGFATSADLWSTLGMQMAKGRWFDEKEEREEAKIALISYHAWYAAFGGRADVLGESVRIGAQDYIVIGVLPKGLAIPSAEMDFAIPLKREERTTPDLTAVVRYPSSADPVAGMVQLAAVTRALLKNRPSAVARPLVRVQSPQRALVAGDRGVFVLVQCAALLVLCAVLANLSSVLLARSLRQQSVFAIEQALGANLRRALAPLFAESILIAGVSAVATVLTTWILFRLLRTQVPPALANAMELRWSVVMTLLAAMTAICLIIPAFTAVTLSRSAGRGAIRNSAHLDTFRYAGKAQRYSVGGQAAVATILIVLLTGVLVSFRIERAALRTGQDILQLGLSAETRDSASLKRDVASLYAFWQDLQLERDSNQVALINPLGAIRVTLSRSPDRQITNFSCFCTFGTTNVLTLFNGRVIRGRWSANAEPNAVALDSASAVLLGGLDNVLGMTLRVPRGPADTVLGEVVAVTSHLLRLGEKLPSGMFEAVIHEDPSIRARSKLVIASYSRSELLVRQLQAKWVGTSGTEKSLMIESTRRALAERERPLKVAQIVGSCLIVIAVSIIGIGAFGLSAGTMALRQREVAIRMAVGASTNSIIWHFCSRELRWTFLASCVGVLAGWGLWRALASVMQILPGVGPLLLGKVLSFVLFILATSLVWPVIKVARMNISNALRAD